MSTTYIEPGDYNFDELVEGVKEGVYIKNFTEWNIDDIRFNEKYVEKIFLPLLINIAADFSDQ